MIVLCDIHPVLLPADIHVNLMSASSSIIIASDINTYAHPQRPPPEAITVSWSFLARF